MDDPGLNRTPHDRSPRVLPAHALGGPVRASIWIVQRWIERAAWWLKPLHDLLLETVVTANKIFCDDTPLPVLDRYNVAEGAFARVGVHDWPTHLLFDRKLWRPLARAREGHKPEIIFISAIELRMTIPKGHHHARQPSL